MRILYLQLGLQIDYIYYCYNHKQFTLHLQYKQTKNVKRQIHNTLIYFQNVPQKMFLDPLNWILQLCWLTTRHGLAINSLQYFCYQNILNVSRMLGICILTLSSKRERINKLLEIINWYFLQLVKDTNSNIIVFFILEKQLVCTLLQTIYATIDEVCIVCIFIFIQIRGRIIILGLMKLDIFNLPLALTIRYDLLDVFRYVS